VKKLILIPVTLIIVSALLMSGCSKTETSKMIVVTSTSLMTYIVEQVGGDYVEAVNLVPPNQHPGNFDATPDDIQKLATAKLFLLHGWPGETFADNLIASANNPDLVVVKANVSGNWMIPSVQAAAVDKVVSVLSEIDPEHATAYQKNAESYKKKIQAAETDIKNRLAKANVSQINVIPSARQADFLQWAGFNVIASFQNAQSLNPQTVQNLVDQGRAGNVSLIVNNLQDGEDAGKAIAEELGAKNLNLSNFPSGFSNTETWEKAIDYNVDMLLDAVK
jgi:zinc transport system substrate-binding protein